MAAPTAETLTSDENLSTYGTFEDEDQVSASAIEVPEERDIIHDILTVALILVIILSVIFWLVNRKPNCKTWPCTGIIGEFGLD